MTRRIVAFTCPETGKTYKTPEFNGDKSEFIQFGKNIPGENDGCSADWENIFNEFTNVKNLNNFIKANAAAQSYYWSQFGNETLPILEYTIAGINIVRDSQGKAIWLKY
jgi:hypothetical protein